MSKYINTKEKTRLISKKSKNIIYNVDPQYTLDKVFFLDDYELHIFKLILKGYSVKEIITIVNKSNFLGYNITETWIEDFVDKYNHFCFLSKTKEERNIDFDINVTDLLPDYFNCRNRFDFPIMLSIRLTNKCDSFCKYCFNNSNTGEITHLEFNRLINILDESYTEGLRSINLTGGDPLLYINFIELLEYLNKRRFSFQFSTKHILTEPEIRKLNRAGLKKIQISLDSVDDEVNYYLTGKKNYFRNMEESIKLLINYGIEVEVNSVVTSSSVKGIPKLFKALRDLEVTRHFLTPFLISSGRGNKELCAQEEKYIRLEEFLNKERLKYQPMEIQLSIPEQSIDYSFSPGNNLVCTGGRLSLVINNNGDVTFCERLLDNKQFVVGNIYKQALTDIWNSDNLKKFVNPSPIFFEDQPCEHCSKFNKCICENGLCYARVYQMNSIAFSIDPFCEKSNNKMRFH